MNPYVARIIDEQEYPLINSIIYADGDMLILESYKSNGKYALRILCRSNIDSYFAYNSTSCISSIAAQALAENDDYSVFAGGGSMGGDGIIFVIDKKSQRPLWFLFLDNSNPFDRITFDTPVDIICSSTSNLKIHFCITKPENMKVFY